MSSLVNAYTSWQPLEEVIVGRAYSPDYFDFVNDAQLRKSYDWSWLASYAFVKRGLT